MASTKYDVVINGVKARLAQDVEGGAYKRRSVRREIQNQIIAQAENPVYRSRDDGVALFQNSWAGGARWWKPLITPQDLASYFQANHMDLWSEPGKVVPGNKHTDAANTSIHDRCIIATNGTDVFAIGDTNTTAAAARDVYKWTPGSNAWVRETGYSSGIQDDSIPLSMTYDSSDGYFYVLAELAAGGREVGRFNPATAASNLTWYTSGPSNPLYGAAIVTSPFGLFFNLGGAVFELDKSGPTATEIYNPGNIEIMDHSNTNVVGQMPLLISTPQGMYLVRNTIVSGTPVATIYRIDRDVSGAFVGNPITVLPRGSVALSAIYHLGQLLVATTPDWRDLSDGEEDLEVVVYFVGEGGIGALGSVLGSRDELDETPYAFLGAEGQRVYLAGSKRLWVYDSTRGGLHSAWEWETAQADGGYSAMARAQDSAGDEILLFLAKDRMNYVKASDVDDPDTVAAFGDDLTHYTLESNNFDANLPLELKEITEVSILKEKDDGGSSKWTVQVSADNRPFENVLQSGNSSVFDTASVSGVSGYQFRYKLIYQTTDTNRTALRAILVTMATGTMVTEWDLVLDGSNLRNLDNQPQDPESFINSIISLGNNSSIVTLIDNYTHNRDADTGDAGTNVKVVAVEIVKDVPGESVVRVLLREA